MANKWCKLITNGNFLSIRRGKLSSGPCCWAEIEIDPAAPFEHFVKQRKKLENRIIDRYEGICYECIAREGFDYEKSARQKQNVRIADDAPDFTFKRLWLQIDNTCNAACIMCCPEFSSKWADIKGQACPVAERNAAFEWVKKHALDDAEVIVFLGGEPFISKNCIDIINSIKHPENVALSFTSNGSVFPEDISTWKKFRKIQITFSVDGIGDRFNYGRWPLKWETVSNNIKRFIDLKRSNKFPDVRLKINYTVNPLNILYFDEFEKWHSSITNEDEVNTSLGVCVNEAFGLEYTPDAIREAVYLKYGPDHRITAIMKSVPRAADSRFVNLLKEAEKLDAVRGNSVYDTFPEVTNLSNRKHL